MDPQDHPTPFFCAPTPATASASHAPPLVLDNFEDKNLILELAFLLAKDKGGKAALLELGFTRDYAGASAHMEEGEGGG